MDQADLELRPACSASGLKLRGGGVLLGRADWLILLPIKIFRTTDLAYIRRGVLAFLWSGGKSRRKGISQNRRK